VIQKPAEGGTGTNEKKNQECFEGFIEGGNFACLEA
jgi:hypothetical protein